MIKETYNQYQTPITDQYNKDTNIRNSFIDQKLQLLGVEPRDDIMRYDNYNYKDDIIDEKLGIDWKHRDESIILINKNNDGLHLNNFNNEQKMFNKTGMNAGAGGDDVNNKANV